MRRLVFLASCALVACGGGGGATIDISPASLTLRTYEGDAVRIGIMATVNAYSGLVYRLEAEVVDPGGVLEGPAESSVIDDARLQISLRLSRSLAPGEYSGTWQLRLCEGDTASCARRAPGSPWTIPYRITVVDGTDLSELTKLPGAGAWTTFQGNASHDGFVPATLAPERFQRRWGYGGKVSPVAVENGLVFVVVEEAPAATDPFMDPTWRLVAIREQDGEEEWSADLGSSEHMSPPGLGGGKVFLNKGHIGASSAFIAIDQTTGEELQRLYTSGQFFEYGAPVAHGGAVYGGSGPYGGLLRFDPATLTLDWAALWNGLNDHPYSLAVDDAHVYGRNEGALELFDPATGTHQATIPDGPTTMNHWAETGGAVLDGAGLAYASSIGSTNGTSGTYWPGRLVCYDVAGLARKWALDGSFSSPPVLADGVLYVVNGGSLEARSPSTGARSWTWTPAQPLLVGGDPSSLVVAGDIAFVADLSRTWAVDLDTHRTVWTYPAGGPLAISDNGVLYISSSAGNLVAVNLQ